MASRIRRSSAPMEASPQSGSSLSSPFTLWPSRWLVLVASLWVQSCSGVGYAFGSYSSLLKTVLGYSQQQIAILGIAKALGGSVGLAAGTLSGILPPWCLIAIGALHTLIGYGWLWLIVTGRTPILPMWAVCILILIGTHGDTYLNTAPLVTNVYNFPKSRGHVMGLLKGFNGLCSAIFTQIYMTFFAPDQASYILIIALGPPIVSLSMMFLVRRIDSSSELRGRPSDRLGFYFIYGDCLIMAAYLMGVLILQDVVTVSFEVSLLITVGLLAIVIFPLATPLVIWAAERRVKRESQKVGVNTTLHMSGIRGRVLNEVEEAEVPLLEGDDGVDQNKEVVSEIVQFPGRNPIEAAKLHALISKMDQDKEPNTSEDNERKKKISAGRERMITAAAAKQGAHEFTVWEAFLKLDSWLLFCVMVCGVGTGMAAIDNMGQITQSQGYRNTSIFVSMASIFNFVGRVLGGYISEILSRDYKLPRSWALGVAQGMMVLGHLMIAMGWPYALYVSTILIGIGYGSHWSIVLPILSELFGMKIFGILYNVYSMSVPLGLLFFSTYLVGYFYDLEAAKQEQTSYIETVLASSSTLCSGSICFRFSFLVMAGFCIFGIFLTTILSIRTRNMYKTLYDSEDSCTTIPTQNNAE